jgi:hypothetical protein
VAAPYQSPQAEVECERGCGPNQQRGAGSLPPGVRRPVRRGGEEPLRPEVQRPLTGGVAGTGAGPSSLNPRLVAMWALAGLAVAAAAAVPLVRFLRRRRRIRRARAEPRRLVLATYDVLTERAADLGLGRSAGETPREYLLRLGASDRLGDGHLERLTALATRAAYSAQAIDGDDALDAVADAREVLRSLRRTAPPLRRLTGVYRRE